MIMAIMMIVMTMAVLLMKVCVKQQGWHVGVYGKGFWLARVRGFLLWLQLLGDEGRNPCTAAIEPP